MWRKLNCQNLIPLVVDKYEDVTKQCGPINPSVLQDSDRDQIRQRPQFLIFFEKLTGRLQTKAEQREASHLAILAMLVQFPKLIWGQFGGDFPYKPSFMVSFSSLSKVAWIYHPNEHDKAVMSWGPRGRLRSLRFGITLHFKVHPVAHLQVLSSESPPAMCQRKNPKNHLQKLRFEPPETWKLQEYSIHHLQKLSFEPAKT